MSLLVVATVLDSALTTIFQWRLYRELFNGRAVKTMVIAAAGMMVASAFRFDMFARVMVDAGGDGQSGGLSAALSAVMLAGGSAAVYELLKRLGCRPPAEAPEDKPKPAATEAWVSVKIVNERAIGRVSIYITEVTAAGEVANPPALAGVVGRRTFLDTLRDMFFADASRFPSNEGRTVDAGKDYQILASGTARSDDASGVVPLERDVSRGRFAGKAIVDLVEEI